MPRKVEKVGLAVLAVLVTLPVASGCSSTPPPISGSTSLRLQERLDPQCLAAELGRQPGVTKVRGEGPIRFVFTPQGQSKGYDFQLRQEQVGLNQGWVFIVSGKVEKRVVDPTALVDDLGPEATALRDAVANGCGAQIIPTG